ncbi:hypothetical protein SUDANB6_00591 [Streptomyces sp. enrichment culture]|uniref:sensor histidine kinase n=1 Tax=Streptomyces sp. enrichment culture TaxID=1795815 RepID=UPI003F55FFC0
MSHLRAPATRADRSEGGRHGRPPARTTPALPETRTRSRLLRLAVLPPVTVALGAGAAVLFTVRSTGIRPGPALWAVLTGAACVTLAAVAVAVVAAGSAVRSVRARVDALRRGAAHRESELRALVEALRRGEDPPPHRQHGDPSGDADGTDGFGLLAADLARVHDGAVTAVLEAARFSSRAGSEQRLEVFVNLARRLQSLVHREISLLDELENEVEDPDLLKGLFHVDHLATRIRRHAENLAVLGGAVPRRQWSNPVGMTEVLRSAIAEVEQYSRVKLVPPIDGTLRGHAVADVIHLLAELVENATVFSAPHTQVLLRAGRVTSGLAVEVEDRGLGMPAEEQERMNALLADPDQVDVARLLTDGRIGLYVVSQLARRHGVVVRLQTNIYGGVQAVVVVPQDLLGTEPDASAATARAQEPAGDRRTAPPAQEPQPRSGRQPPVPRPEPALPAPAVPGSRHEDDARPPAPAARGGGAPPLPVRGAHPADAVAGPRPDHRRTPAEDAAAPLVPRHAAVHGTTDRPRLPRRRAQEHLAPQLRGGPAPRRDTGRPAGHDPGLMAAFRRGVGLAEAQQRLETEHREPPAPPGARHAPVLRTTGTRPEPAPAPPETPEGHGASVSRPAPPSGTTGARRPDDQGHHPGSRPHPQRSR